MRLIIPKKVVIISSCLVVARFIYPEFRGTCPVTGRDRAFLKTADESANYKIIRL